jgi:hypothetical protein
MHSPWDQLLVQSVRVCGAVPDLAGQLMVPSQQNKEAGTAASFYILQSFLNVLTFKKGLIINFGH